jgi:hypothetical protein
VRGDHFGDVWWQLPSPSAAMALNSIASRTKRVLDAFSLP